MRRKNKDEVTEVFAGETTSKLTCEKIASRTITGVFAVLLVTTIAISAEKGVTKERASTKERADTSSSNTATVTTSESTTTTTVVTTSSTVTTKKEATTTKAETKKEEADSSSVPEVTTTTTTTAATQVEAPPIQTYNAGNYSTDTWVEYNTDTAPIVTTVVEEEASEDKETNNSEDAPVAEGNIAKSWDGPVLNSSNGIISGPSGNETYYNLYMGGVVANMQSMGYDYDYWVRDDGVKMYGDYVMVAADLSTRPKGTIVETSLGEGIVCDTGGFVNWDPNRLDIATAW